ncbi:MAG: PepSY1/2 domain-containing protein [Candidatus Fimimonas sp.]
MVKNNSTIKNFWMIFFGIVALLAIATTVFVCFSAADKVARMRMSVVDDENTYKISQENSYKRSLYAACDSMKNLDANLGKASISTSAGNQAQMLTNAVIHANQVNQCLSSLPIAESENLEACQKFVNQTQDFATYLLKKISNGEQLSAADRMALANLDNVATNLYNFLEKYAESDSGMFITNGNGLNNNGALSDSLDSVKENTFSYEKLIYDGPFSDSVQEKTLKSDKALSHEDVGEKVSEIFGKCRFVQNLNNKGLWYCYQTDKGRVTTTSDGYVAEYECYAESEKTEKSLSAENCIAKAEEFCQKLGYDVKGVWVSKTQDQTTYVNCATVVDDVIVYPELIKVAVDSYSGEIVGCEAKPYLFNRQNRDVTMGQISEQEAQKHLGDGLKVTNVAKALVEKNNQQYVCYEFECEMNGRQYYVYVDSKTGNEVEIFKVIENTEGYTVM